MTQLRMPATISSGYNSPATPTPYVDGERVHVYFGAYGLICYDLDRRELWKKPIITPRSLYGSATSPIEHGDNLILVLDTDANLPDSKLSQSRILALKKSSGDLAWETARPFQRSGWSTPTIWKHADSHLYLVSNRGHVSVVKAGDAFDLVHQHDLGEPAFVTPAFDATTIYIPTQTNLCAFRIPPSPGGRRIK